MLQIVLLTDLKYKTNYSLEQEKFNFLVLFLLLMYQSPR